MLSTESSSTSPRPSYGRWCCGVVSVSDQGYESFEPADLTVTRWLADQLGDRLGSYQGDHRAGLISAPVSSRESETRRGEHLGADCYHLKGQGGISKALADLSELLPDYPYIIRSDARGYYAHIQHHKLLEIMRSQHYGHEVCHVTLELCQRMTCRGGVYRESLRGIPLGCAASPLLAAIYLSPLDQAIATIPGVKYLRYMDDWVILCPNKWKMRRAVKLMHQTLDSLGLTAHPDKTFIGRVERGFDFLGVDFQAGTGASDLSQVSQQRLGDKLRLKLSSAARLYEQGRLHSLGRLELYLTHWLRWSQGIGIATSTALAAMKRTLKIALCQNSADVMIPTFVHSLLSWVKQQVKTIKYNETTKNKQKDIITNRQHELGTCIHE